MFYKCDVREISQKNMSGILEKHVWKTIIFKKIAACKNFSKVLCLKKMHNSFRQVLQTYSETCISCVVQDIVIQRQSVKVVLKVLGKFLITGYDDVMKFIS